MACINLSLLVVTIPFLHTYISTMILDSINMEEGYHRGIEKATRSFWNQLIIYQSIDTVISMLSFAAAAYYKKIGDVTAGIASLIVALISSALVSVLFNAYHFRKTSKILILILSKTSAIANSQKKIEQTIEQTSSISQKIRHLYGKLTDPSSSAVKGSTQSLTQTADSKLIKRYETFRRVSPVIFKILLQCLGQVLLECLWAGFTLNTQDGMAWATLSSSWTATVLVTVYFLSANRILIEW